MTIEITRLYFVNVLWYPKKRTANTSINFMRQRQGTEKGGRRANVVCSFICVCVCERVVVAFRMHAAFRIFAQHFTKMQIQIHGNFTFWRVCVL